MTTQKFVRMLGSNTTEVNIGAVLYAPHDDGAFYLSEAHFEQGLKAGLVPAPLSAGDKIAKILDALDELNDGERQALHHVIATRAPA